MKPKPLSKRHEERLRSAATSPADMEYLTTVREIRAILAALEYERQRAAEWERKYVEAAGRAHIADHIAMLEKAPDNHAEHVRERQLLTDVIMEGEQHVRSTIAKAIQRKWQDKAKRPDFNPPQPLPAGVKAGGLAMPVREPRRRRG